MSEHKEPIPSMIYNASVGGHVTSSQQIIDENENKEQSQINSEVKQILGTGGSVDARINQTKNDIIGGASSNGNTLRKIEDRVSPLESAVGTGGSVDSRISSAVAAETTRAHAVEEQLRTLYNNLQQSQPIPVTSLPATGETGKIYRLAGTNSYADYMYAEGALTTPIKMAEYDNAIDDKPTPESNNLVKSGGITTKYGTESYIKSLTSADYAGIIWAGEESGIIPAVQSYNGYVIPLVEGKKYEIDFSKINTYGSYPVSGMSYIRRINEAEPFVATSDEKYGLITVNTESPNISVICFDSGLFDVEKQVNLGNRLYDVSLCGMIYDGTNVINYTQTVNSILIYVPKYKNIVCIGGLGERAEGERVYCLSVRVFSHKPKIGYGSSVFSTRGIYVDGIWQIDISGYNNSDGCYLMFMISPWSTIDYSNLYVTMQNKQYNNYYRLQGKNILCLGDSIMEFENYDNYNIPGYIKQLVGKSVADCGIGGTQLSRRGNIDVTTISGSYAALDIVSLVDAIYNEDFTQQVAAAQYLRDNAQDDNTYQIATLQAVDFNNLDYIVILAGTNDWTGNKQIGTDTDAGDYTTIKGAIRTITRLILSKYKHIKLLFVTPPVRYFQVKDRAHWCDVWQNDNGDTLTDVVNAIISSTKFNNLPVLDIYNGLGWNEFNFDVYFYDKLISGDDKVDPTHPRSGFKQIALKICDFINVY